MPYWNELRPASSCGTIHSMTDTKYDRWPSLRLYEKLGVPYMVVDNWNGPLWTGSCMVLDATDSYGDPGFLHELFHWLCASKEQRKYADLALGRQINATAGVFTASGLPFYDGKDVFPVGSERDTSPKGGEHTHNPGWGELTVSRVEAARQEDLACHAMWLHDPIVGNCAWDDIPGPTDAAVDFSDNLLGMPKHSLPVWAEVKKVIVSKLCPDVSMATIRSFVEAQNASHMTHGYSCSCKNPAARFEVDKPVKAG